MTKKTMLSIPVILFVIFGYTVFQKNDNLVIPLHQEYSEPIPINDYPVELFLKTLDKYPNYKKQVMETSIGIPENDSLCFYYRQDSNILFDIYKSGDLSKKQFLKNLNHIQIDTLELPKIKLPDHLIFVVGFKKGKQFVIADVNRNSDFSDDFKYEFDINFRNNVGRNERQLNELSATDYKYQVYNKGSIQEYNRKFVLYPDRNHPFCFDNGKKERDYFSVLRFKDFWKANCTIDNQETEFYYFGLSNKHGRLYVKPKEIPFNFTDKNANSQFKHLLTDTIPIAGSYYVIDSINSAVSKLYLRNTGKKTNSYGNTTGTYLKNVEFKDLENKPFKTQDIIEKKKYTLIDFWGTWCGSCRELTPRIKKASKDYASKLNIIGVAVDDNKEAVKEYILKNEMSWKNAYLSNKEKRNDRSYKQFNIQYFPTLILLDSKGKIIYRGNSNSFDKILKLIK